MLFALLWDLLMGLVNSISVGIRGLFPWLGVFCLCIVLAVPGCSPGDKGTIEEQIEYRAEVGAQFVKLAQDLGIDADVMLDVDGGGFAGAFTGAIWDFGISLKAHMRTNVDQAKLLQEALERLKKGDDIADVTRDLRDTGKFPNAAEKPLKPRVAMANTPRKLE